MNDVCVDTGRTGPRVLTAAAGPAELAAELAAAARELTGAPFACATVAGAAASSGEAGGGTGTTVPFDGGSIMVEAGAVAAGALRELADYAAVATPYALEHERHKAVHRVVRHDMRTAVGIGQGFVTMLERHYDALTAEQRAAALAGLRDSLDKLGRHMRRSLLDEQLEIDGMVPHRADTALGPVLAAIARDYPQVVVEADPAVPATIPADPQMLREILDNLVDNAVAAAPAGSAVTVTVTVTATASVTADPAWVRFAVHDLGPGFTPADRAVMFQRHGRTAASHAARSPGLGLGLSIVRRLVEAHGGAYGVTGGDGSGTTFWVTLPLTYTRVVEV